MYNLGTKSLERLKFCYSIGCVITLSRLEGESGRVKVLYLALQCLNRLVGERQACRVSRAFMTFSIGFKNGTLELEICNIELPIAGLLFLHP